MEEYAFRRAAIEDVSFIAEVIIEAEKSSSGNLSFSSLFNLTEDEVKALLIKILNEEVEGCEFSINSYIVAEYNKKPVAAIGAWIEEFDGNLPSAILKANLISAIFPKESLQYLKSKLDIISELQIEREKLALQLEYSYVINEHRGKGLYGKIIHKLIEDALIQYPELKKVQFQVYKTTTQVIGFFEKQNYQVVKIFKSNHPDILNYLPCDEKLLMEKTFK
jgi:ribosomal protein S18 acetylase RimI-like enzyme